MLLRTLLLLWLLPLSSFSQEPISAIEIPELNVLYRGYPNKILVAVTNNKGREINVSSTNCEIIKDSTSEYYLVKPGKGKTVLICVELIDSDTIFYSKTTTYRVSNLPDPSLYWGAAKAGRKASLSSRIILAKYPPEIPLKASFKITDWTVSLGDSTSISGQGANLKAANELFESIKKEQTVRFEVNVVGPDKKERTIFDQFIVAPGSGRKPVPMTGCG